MISTIAFAQDEVSQSDINALQNRVRQGYQKAYEGARLMKEIQSRLVPIQRQILTLKDQIALLDEQYQATRKLIQDTEKQMLVKTKETELMEKQKAVYEKESEQQKKVLLDLGKMIYDRQSPYFDIQNDTVSISNTKLLLASTSIADVKNRQDYLIRISDITKRTLVQNESNLEKLVLTKNLIAERSDQLKILNTKLRIQKEMLITQKQARDMLLNFTKGSEEAYQDILKEAQKEQQEVVNEVKAYQSQLRSIQELLDVTNPDHKTALSIFEWPIDPSQGISAFFHDPGYQERFGIPHNAIDIRTPEGTEIHAPADGYVYKVHDGGMGYSYLILAHRSNMMTVYGHLLEFRVKEGDIVQEGQVVGLSGGTPGTKGAGLLTTGAHLHFEVFKEGEHVDPLSVLNLGILPINSIPKEYL